MIYRRTFELRQFPSKIFNLFAYQEDLRNILGLEERNVKTNFYGKIFVADENNLGFQSKIDNLSLIMLNYLGRFLK